MGITITAADVAKYLIRYSCDKKSPISNLKLQKLLYYCQGWHLGILSAPLFHDPIQAWVHGPVVPNVFQEYRQFRWSPITAEVKSPDLPAQSGEIVDAVLQEYWGFSAAQLEQLSHNEDPWKIARGGLPPDFPCTREITHVSMRKYFGSLANG
jgi:uncharacterized phage-associated protein